MRKESENAPLKGRHLVSSEAIMVYVRLDTAFTMLLFFLISKLGGGREWEVG